MEELTTAWEQARAMIINALTEYVISQGNVADAYVERYGHPDISGKTVM